MKIVRINNMPLATLVFKVKSGFAPMKVSEPLYITYITFLYIYIYIYMYIDR